MRPSEYQDKNTVIAIGKDCLIMEASKLDHTLLETIDEFHRLTRNGKIYILKGRDSNNYQLHFESLQFKHFNGTKVEFKFLLENYPTTRILVKHLREKLKRYIDNNGQLHRLAGPALIKEDGTKLYYEHGKLHNAAGPAIIEPFGKKFYYRNGKFIRSEA